MTTKAEEGEKSKHCLSLNDEPGTGLGGIVAIAETMFGLHTHERLPHSVFPPARAISLRSEGILEEDCRWRFLEAENGKPPKERRELREERKIWNTWDGKEREYFLQRRIVAQLAVQKKKDVIRERGKMSEKVPGKLK